MAQRTILVNLILITIILTPAEIFGIRLFDGERRGFIFEINLGLGATSINYDYIYRDIEISDKHLTKGAVGFEGRLGYAPTNRFQVYLVNKMSIFDAKKMVDDYENYFDKMSGEGVLSALYIIFSPIILPFIPYASSHSTIGFGASYYLEEEAPSFFVDAGLGGAIIYNPFADKVEGGRGFYAGGGYEFQKNLQAKFDLMYGWVDSEIRDYESSGSYITLGTQKISALTFIFHLSFSFY
jgi:hypothetical protein